MTPEENVARRPDATRDVDDAVGEDEDVIEAEELLDLDDLFANEDAIDAKPDVTTERDEYLDALRRLQAEFDNFRKRTVRDQSGLIERATESLLERLLPVLDAMDLALAHAQGEDNELLPVFTQIDSLLRTTLEKEGLERIDEAGVSFDPTIHDAVAHLPQDESAEGKKTDHRGPSVAEVMRAGYRLKGRVLRPAMVAVTG